MTGTPAGPIVDGLQDAAVSLDDLGDDDGAPGHAAGRGTHVPTRLVAVGRRMTALLRLAKETPPSGSNHVPIAEAP